MSPKQFIEDVQGGFHSIRSLHTTDLLIGLEHVSQVKESSLSHLDFFLSV